MKKWFIGFLTLVILALIGAYIFIPKKMIIAKTDIIVGDQIGTVRYFSNKSNWIKWLYLDAKKNDTDSILNSFFYNGASFSATNKTHDGLEIIIGKYNTEIKSILTFYALSKDSMAMEWKCEMDGGSNIFQRIGNYKKALSVKNDMTDILNKLRAFIKVESNLYGLDIKHEIITDTLVISQKASFSKYPTTTEIYGMIDQLKKYALANNAGITGQPMMNTTITVDSFYQTMVAISVSKPLKNVNGIELKHLTPGTPMLTATVRGGTHAAAEALIILENYKTDHQFSSPAIPYNILITDRDKQSDTTKWKTKVCVLLFPWFR